MPKGFGTPDASFDADVAIVGAGPVGLMIANLLGIAGIRTLVLERNDGLLGLPRAIAYDAETLRLFTQVGLFEKIAPGLIQNPHVQHLNARGKTLMEADFPKLGPFGHSSLGTFYQPDFERVLLAGLERFDCVQTRFERNVLGIEQDADGVALKIAASDGERIVRAKYAIGCDGGASGVRDMIGARMLGSTYTERWLVIDAIAAGHDVTQITFGCDPRRPRVELPAVGERVRWEFMQLPGETEETLRSDATIRSLVSKHTKYRDFKIERKAVYTFHARVADRWRSGRVFLAGDAAHLMPPFAGQGMNGGMKDAVNLAWKLVAVLQGQSSDVILDTYEVERRPVVRKMVEVSRRLGSIIMPTSKAVALARDTLFGCLNLSSAFRDFIRRGGVVPPPTIERSALTGAGRDGLIGQMVPQPTLSGAEQLDRRLSCHQWLALGVGVDPVSRLSKRDLAILESLGTRFICLNAPAQHPLTMALTCTDASFLAWAKRYSVRTALVRPDRFIADRFDGADLAVLTPLSLCATAEPARAAA